MPNTSPAELAFSAQWIVDEIPAWVGKTGNNGPDMMTNPGPSLATFPVQSTVA